MGQFAITSNASCSSQARSNVRLLGSHDVVLLLSGGVDDGGEVCSVFGGKMLEDGRLGR
jgi:hypothetical protein